MKEKVIKILVFIILFNYIFTQFSFATEGESDAEENESPENSAGFYVTEDEFNQYNNEGTGTYNGNKYNNNFASTQSTPGAISGTIAKVLCVIPLLVNKTFNSIANQGGFIDFNTVLDSEANFKFITIEKIVFGKYYLFNANVFRDSEDLEVTKKDGTDPDDVETKLVETLDKLRENVSTWYYVMRLISLVIGLLTLIYIGIRMATSTVAGDQAKYKKMLWGWVQSIVIIVILPYVMTILNYIAKILLDIITKFRESLLMNGQGSFENTMIAMIYGDLDKAGGFNLVSKVLVFTILSWAQFKFFMMYLKRLLAVSFLTIISPLITITYSIDKAGDGKAQAFEAWFKEYLMNILIQPLQAILYLVFVFSANQIAIDAPLVGIIFLLSLTRAEKIVKTIFNMRGLSSMHTMQIFKKDK